MGVTKISTFYRLTEEEKRRLLVCAGPSKGVREDETGNVYEGELLQEKRHGYGKMIYTEGGVYEGEWKDNLRQTGENDLCGRYGLRR
ncbi:MAG: hypothetical protein IJV76_07185 [Clostridia bacterium]|nr:hypothetical protein [Clostridia bacterium]